MGHDKTGPRLVTVPIRVFGRQIGTATIEVEALADALDGDGIRAPKATPLTPAQLATSLVRLARAGAFGGILETETESIQLEAQTASPLPHVRERRRRTAALNALQRDRELAWAKDREGRRGEVSTEPWPALSLEFVRHQITQVLLYGSKEERQRLVAAFTAPRGQPPKVRGGRPYASDLRHHLTDVLGAAMEQPEAKRGAWLNRNHPDVAAMLHLAGFDTLDGEAEEIAADVVERETGYEQVARHRPAAAAVMRTLGRGPTNKHAEKKPESSRTHPLKRRR